MFKKIVKLTKTMGAVGGFLFLMSLVFLAIFSLLFVRINNSTVSITEYACYSDKVSDSIKIVQISDFHDFPNGNEVTSLVLDESPDIIVTTGDMFDGNRPDLEKTLELYKGLSSLGVTIYYVSGNHEATKPELLSVLEKHLEILSVKILINEVDTITIKDNNINMIGLSKSIKYSKQMCELEVPEDNLNLVLCHFPEDFDKLLGNERLYYGKELGWKMDFLFTGHAHGGQIRLFGEGLYSPSQGFFPKYTHGMYDLGDNQKLIVNSGLGNSTFPIRINNQPEIVSLTIYPE